MTDTNKKRNSSRPASNGPGLAKAMPRNEQRPERKPRVSDAERLQKRVEAAKQRHQERIAKIQAREKVRTQERKAWQELLAKQKIERDEYRKLTLEQRIGNEGEDTGVHRRVEAA